VIFSIKVGVKYIFYLKLFKLNSKAIEKSKCATDYKERQNMYNNNRNC